MAETKKKGRPSKAEQEKKRKQEELARQLEATRQKYAWTFFILGIVFCALAFVEGQNVWQTLHRVTFGVFGLLSYTIGPIMIYLAIVFAVGKTPPLPKVLKALFLILTVSGMFYIFGALEPTDFVEDMKQLYDLGAQQAGGGALSALFGWTLESLCGDIAAKIMIIVMLLLAVMLISGKTVLDLVNGVKQSADTVRERRQLSKEMKENTAEIELPPAVTEKEAKFDVAVALDAKGGTSASIDIPLDEVRSAIDISLDGKRAKPGPPPAAAAMPGSRIDIPLGPVADGKSSIHIDLIDPRQPSTPRGTGPAADVVDDVFKREDKINDLFTDFGSEETPSLDELIKREAKEKAVPHAEGDVKSRRKTSEYKYPPLSSLDKPDRRSRQDASEELRANASALVTTLESFGVKTRVVDISRGPTVTRYELQPEVGVRLSRIVNLADDLALNLAAMGVRIEAPIPGKAAVGIEVPNKETTIVKLRSILESSEFRGAKSPLTISMGMDLSGDIRVGDISKFPHMLIAGSTGMGKSVFINSMIISLVYKSSPEELKLLLIDPKMVEFTVYKGLPHLPVPVVTEPSRAAGALETALAEMLRRYKQFADKGVRNIEEYNAMVERDYPDDYIFDEDEEVLEKKARWVIVIDELADLMMTAPREVENAICRIAQMGRAAGIHLVVATQRPSVDVITGTIKNNIPTRIAFRVSSQIDSRTILDGSGAEKLIGRGDMLFQPVGAAKPIRIQGCYVSDEEVARVVKFIQENSVAQYNEDLVREIEENAVLEKGANKDSGKDGGDAILDQAIEVVVEAGKASTSYLQRRLKIGYARAASLIDEMEEMGIVGPADGSKPRVVNMSRQQWQERLMNRTDLE